MKALLASLIILSSFHAFAAMPVFTKENTREATPTEISYFESRMSSEFVAFTNCNVTRVATVAPDNHIIAAHCTHTVAGKKPGLVDACLNVERGIIENIGSTSFPKASEDMIPSLYACVSPR